MIGRHRIKDFKLETGPATRGHFSGMDLNYIVTENVPNFHDAGKETSDEPGSTTSYRYRVRTDGVATPHTSGSFPMEYTG